MAGATDSDSRTDLSTDPLLENAPTHEGYKVLGGVVIYQKLGQGGMGAVYRGKHLRLNIDVAVKVMDPPAGVQASRAGEFVRRFIREAQTAAAVSHQNLIRVYDVNVESGVHFLIMDFVDGESAGDRLRRKGKLVGGKPAGLDEEEAVEVALGAAEGLAEAHRRGVVHRDVKPDNIMIDKEGRVRVTDLGLAKAASGESDSGPSLLTQTQTAMGTPHYMSPEQFVSARDVGPQADVWSLGVTLYQLLTGSLPWTEPSVFTLAAKIQSEPFPDPKTFCAGLSDGACAIIERALRKQAAERYAECGEMADALRAHLDSIRSSPGSKASVLPDAAAGSTKRAAVSLTPPPPKTLTLIGVSLIAAGESARAEAPAGVGPSPAAAATPGTLAAPRRGGAGMVLLGLLLAAVLGGGGFAAWYFLAGPGSERERTGLAAGEGEPPDDPAATRLLAKFGDEAGKHLGPAKTLTLDPRDRGGVRLEVVLVPAGEFMMGSRDSAREVARKSGYGGTKVEWFTREHPRHRVRITQPFYMGKYEVTQSQYERIMGTNPSHFKGTNLPVETVSWTDAEAFCRKLSQRTGRQVRLPTEAEWEYACRAGTTTASHYGDSLNSTQANFDGNYPYGGAAKGTFRRKTTVVGSFQPNAWGLYDMHGNLWEWCSDWYDEGYYAKSPGTDPQGSGIGKHPVLRGGSWYHSGYGCRSAFRTGCDPPYRHGYTGFRVAVSAPGQ